jgi:hypothetical protein
MAPNSPIPREKAGSQVMKTVCLGWLRTHAAPIVLADDGRGDKSISIGMCEECVEEWQQVAGVSEERREVVRDAYIRYLKGREPDPRD